MNLFPLFPNEERDASAIPGGLIIDLFAGGGGAALGIEWALGRSPDIGINHSWDALRNHQFNHPKTTHLVDDIRDVDPLVATKGEPVDVLWASPDCRHFSPAKGGKPCNPKIRTLPWEVTKWARAVKPRLIAVENVPAMRTWGPLHEKHDHGCTSTADLELDEKAFERCTSKRCRFSKPIKGLAGATWKEWLQAFRDLEYKVEWWILQAHHFGAPTSRKRLFIVARNDGVKPVCPEPTHGPGLLPVRTAAECIDWSDLGESIFDANGNTRHAPATLRRIATGVMRYVVEAASPFIVTCNHGKEGFRGQGLEEPFKTLTASHDAHGLVVPTLVQTGYGERPGQAPRSLDIRKPLGTVVAGAAKHAFVAAFLAKHYGHGLRGLATPDEPLRTQTTSTGQALVATFLSTYYGQSVGQRVDEPMATQTTKHRHALVTVTIDGVEYVIVDISMRMLKASELKLAQGLPASYRLEGTQKLQVALIGNSVPPQFSEAIKEDFLVLGIKSCEGRERGLNLDQPPSVAWPVLGSGPAHHTGWTFSPKPGHFGEPSNPQVERCRRWANLAVEEPFAQLAEDRVAIPLAFARVLAERLSREGMLFA